MKPVKVFLLSLLMCAITGAVVYFIVEREHKKTGVVDAIKLFNQFNMKKELEENAKAKLQSITKQADSINNMLQMARATKNDEEIKKLSYAYNYISARIENEYKESNSEINEQVWKRLNPIIDQYAKKKGLHLLIGANGMGSVLYDDEYYDLTDEMIKFVNKKYEEGN